MNTRMRSGGGHNNDAKRMAPTAPQYKSLVIQPVGSRPRGRPRRRFIYKNGAKSWDPDWTKGTRPIVYPLDAEIDTFINKGLGLQEDDKVVFVLSQQI